MIEKFDTNKNIANMISCFVHRDENVEPKVVRILPETRPTIQIILGDDYWLKSNKQNSEWEKVPKVAFWGPKYEWCYGFSKKHIRVFGLAITPDLYKKITDIPISEMIDKVIPLCDLNAGLANELSKNLDNEFTHWMNYVENIFKKDYEIIRTENLNFSNISEIFAQNNEDGLIKASQNCNLSIRQFRRNFIDYFGVSPKKYQRVMRVDRLLRSLHDYPWEKDEFANYPLWFSDQAHLIREFKSLTGITPRQYLISKKNSDSTLRSVYVDGIKPPILV